jgi:drug/metabolite transporter (DMT)-like permease
VEARWWSDRHIVIESTTAAPSSSRRTGLALASITALISGVAVFVNGYGVRAWADVADATTYTTAKNLVAAAILTTVALLAGSRQTPERRTADDKSRRLRTWALLGAVAVVGGSVPFVLFFEGFSRATSTRAGFIHKTLVIWVTVMAVVVLRERIGPIHVAAVALLVWGQAAIAGGIGGLALGAGELLMLAATVLWSMEVIIVKRLLVVLSSHRVAVARMLGGGVALVLWMFATGRLHPLPGLAPQHLAWVAVTGLLLALYVGTWFAALARAPAVDVTAVLVAGALVTALLESGIRSAPLPAPLGLLGVACGTAIVLAHALETDVR